MKNSLLFLVLFVLISCKSDDDSTNPIDQLPPATQTGANTFGCLVNGESFNTRGAPFGPPSKGASYQYVYSPINETSHYQFSVFGRNSYDEPYRSVAIDLKFENFQDFHEGIYYLSTFENGGEGFFYTGGIDGFLTDMNNTGTITITHYDYENRIVSGIFEFDINVNGDIYHITDGRFDLNFTL